MKQFLLVAFVFLAAAAFLVVPSSQKQNLPTPSVAVAPAPAPVTPAASPAAAATPGERLLRSCRVYQMILATEAMTADSEFPQSGSYAAWKGSRVLSQRVRQRYRCH